MDKQRILFDDTIIDLGHDFLKELLMPHFGHKMKGHVFITKHILWSYKKTTTMRLYWLNKKTWIHELVEIKWQHYLKESLSYPKTSFANYLLTQKWGAHFEFDTVETEIRVWFEMRNKILQ